MEGADDGLAGGTCQAPLNHESEKRPREEAIDGATQGLSNGPAQKKGHQGEQWHDEVQALANHVLQASSLSTLALCHCRHICVFFWPQVSPPHVCCSLLFETADWSLMRLRVHWRAIWNLSRTP